MEAIRYLVNSGQYSGAAAALDKLLKDIELTDYLIPTYEIPRGQISKKDLIEAYFTLGSIYKSVFDDYARKNTSTNAYSDKLFLKSLQNLFCADKLDIGNSDHEKQIVSIYTQMCYLTQDNNELTLRYLREAHNIYPCNAIINYNLGHMLQKNNQVQESIVYYKLAVSQTTETSTVTNSLNSIGTAYKTLREWNHALYYLAQAVDLVPTDPDVNSNLGIVYMELRDTASAIKCYNVAIKNYKRSVISPNKDTLLASIYLNLGAVYAHDGENKKSIEVYDKALSVMPKYILPMQNKLMNTLYTWDYSVRGLHEFTRQHKLINNFLDAVPVTLEKKPRGIRPIRVGFVSGDFLEHPVSFFISGFLERHTDAFRVTCYSQIYTQQAPSMKIGAKYKVIANMSTDACVELIRNDGIDILVDLSGHTFRNRLDIFAKRAAPVQITYIGYPYTTGLVNMDYRITDNICDNESCQDYYTEKLLFLDRCFLAYNATPPALAHTQGTDKKLRIGCFNRLNKFSDNVYKLFTRILNEIPDAVLVFKTKALLDPVQIKKFVERIGVHKDRIQILKTTILHSNHIKEYNNVDISLDTFPYSGTTTSCEALSMGVPVYTLYNNTVYYHPQNVTASLLLNSGLPEFVCDSESIMLEKLKAIDRSEKAKEAVKIKTRQKFLAGNVCNISDFIEKFEELLKNA